MMTLTVQASTLLLLRYLLIACKAGDDPIMNVVTVIIPKTSRFTMNASNMTASVV